MNRKNSGEHFEEGNLEVNIDDEKTIEEMPSSEQKGIIQAIKQRMMGSKLGKALAFSAFLTGAAASTGCQVGQNQSTAQETTPIVGQTSQALTAGKKQCVYIDYLDSNKKGMVWAFDNQGKLVKDLGFVDTKQQDYFSSFCTGDGKIVFNNGMRHHILDLNDPKKLTRLGLKNITGLSCAVHKGFLYLHIEAAGPHNLIKIDLKNPTGSKPKGLKLNDVVGDTQSSPYGVIGLSGSYDAMVVVDESTSTPKIIKVTLPKPHGEEADLIRSVGKDLYVAHGKYIYKFQLDKNFKVDQSTLRIITVPQVQSRRRPSYRTNDLEISQSDNRLVVGATGTEQRVLIYDLKGKLIKELKNTIVGNIEISETAIPTTLNGKSKGTQKVIREMDNHLANGTLRQWDLNGNPLDPYKLPVAHQGIRSGKFAPCPSKPTTNTEPKNEKTTEPVVDGGTNDAGPTDGGNTDNIADGGPGDSGPVDKGSPDGGPADGGSPDGGITDQPQEPSIPEKNIEKKPDTPGKVLKIIKSQCKGVETRVKMVNESLPLPKIKVGCLEKTGSLFVILEEPMEVGTKMLVGFRPIDTGNYYDVEFRSFESFSIYGALMTSKVRPVKIRYVEGKSLFGKNDADKSNKGSLQHRLISNECKASVSYVPKTLAELGAATGVGYGLRLNNNGSETNKGPVILNASNPDKAVLDLSGMVKSGSYSISIFKLDPKTGRAIGEGITIRSNLTSSSTDKISLKELFELVDDPFTPPVGPPPDKPVKPGCESGCSTGGGNGTPSIPVGLAGLGFLLVMRKRKKTDMEDSD